jgi:hypothetical protein
MLLTTLRRAVATVVRRQSGTVKSFTHELQQVGGLTSRTDAGLQVVPTEQVVGSVGRWQELRPDFTFRKWPAVTERHRRVAAAMRAGRELPPLELYALIATPAEPDGSIRREYFVVDGHHRVAMARRMGQDFLDAHVIEYRLARESAVDSADANRRADRTRAARRGSSGRRARR